MTIPYSQLTPDQLRSALHERDDQLRVALARAGEIDQKFHRAFTELHASQERCKELGDLLEIRHDFADQMQRDRTHTNLLPGLREAWRLMNVDPVLDFAPGRILDRIKELEK